MAERVRLSERLVEPSQAEGVDGLPLMAEGGWRPGGDGEPVMVNIGAVVDGTLDDLEGIARRILADCAAIRDEQARRG